MASCQYFSPNRLPISWYISAGGRRGGAGPGGGGGGAGGRGAKGGAVVAPPVAGHNFQVVFLFALGFGGAVEVGAQAVGPLVLLLGDAEALVAAGGLGEGDERHEQQGDKGPQGCDRPPVRPPGA